MTGRQWIRGFGLAAGLEGAVDQRVDAECIERLAGQRAIGGVSGQPVACDRIGQGGQHRLAE